MPQRQRAQQVRRRPPDPGIARKAALDAIESQVAIDALARSGTTTLVSSREGRIVYANAAAERLLWDGAALRAIGGRLAAGERIAAERLTGLVRNAADAATSPGKAAGGTLTIARLGRLPLTVLVTPFRPAHKMRGTRFPAAILFLRDPEVPSATTLALRELFGLTPSEAAIAAAIADGTTVEDIGRGLRITLNTARTHLKKIYAKTGTNRQPQLVALLLRSVAVLMNT